MSFRQVFEESSVFDTDNGNMLIGSRLVCSCSLKLKKDGSEGVNFWLYTLANRLRLSQIGALARRVPTGC